MNETFRSEWLNEPPEVSAEEKAAYKLAEEYHRRTEAYDRLVCSGPIGRDGGIMPANGYQRHLVNANARLVLAELVAEAARQGIPSVELMKQIREVAGQLARKAK